MLFIFDSNISNNFLNFGLKDIMFIKTCESVNIFVFIINFFINIKLVPMHSF